MTKQERNELVERLIQLRDEFRKKGDWTTCDLLADACNELDKMPEIVRCEECKYRTDRGECHNPYLKLPNNYVIQDWLLCHPKWFCADGERKE